MAGEDFRPYLVRRLLAREIPNESERGIGKYFILDNMGAVEFEHGRPEAALAEAVKLARREDWKICRMAATPDLSVHYLGPSSRLDAASRFLQTQLLEDDSERYTDDRPLAETTYLRLACECQADDWCRRLCGWWCIDEGRQFALFKTAGHAALFLSSLDDYRGRGRLGRLCDRLLWRGRA
jgi:hypothetical protein